MDLIERNNLTDVSMGSSPGPLRVIGAGDPAWPSEEPVEAVALWRWAAHCLLGLLLGAVSAALHREPWNEPIHWVNVASLLVILPLYFLIYAAIWPSLGGVGLAICTVVLSEAIAFSAMFYVLHGEIDSDYVTTALGLLVAYLVVFIGSGLLLRLVRRSGKGKRAWPDDFPLE